MARGNLNETNANVIERFGRIFRRAGDSAYLITSCGEWVINGNYKNVVRHYGRTPQYRYLQIDEQLLHRLVGIAWIYNPCPSRFRVVDHIDGDTQNNDMRNLRWVSYTLNSLNRARKKWYEKKVRKGRGGKMQVWYQSKVTVAGEVTRKSSSTPEEATNTTKRLLNVLFNKLYEKTLEKNPERPSRPSHMHCWTDRGSTPAMRPGLSYIIDGEYTSDRTPGRSL